MRKQRLSATVITMNEEKDLARCLKSVCDIADEIVLVDSGSTDNTLEIAKRYKAKIYYRKFDNYSNQKNFANDKTTGDWILSLDADEEITPDLAKEIIYSIKIKDINGYLIPRKNIILGKEIKHTRWSPDRHIWLWRKRKGKWVGEVHEEVVVDGWVAGLKNFKIHYSYETVADFWDMMNTYTRLIAEEKVKKGEKFSYRKLLFSPFVSFTRRFFYKKGFLDGWRGFILSYLMAIYRMTEWIKVWERSKT